MPPRNTARSLENTQNLARRIRIEREERGMSYETLAKCMTTAGCLTYPSQIHKSEKGTPLRNVTISELVAYAEVFGTSIDDLLMPVEVRNRRRVQELLLNLESAEEKRKQICDQINSITAELSSISNDDAEVNALVSQVLGA